MNEDTTRAELRALAESLDVPPVQAQALLALGRRTRRRRWAAQGGALALLVVVGASTWGIVTPGGAGQTAVDPAVTSPVDPAGGGSAAPPASPDAPTAGASPSAATSDADPQPADPRALAAAAAFAAFARDGNTQVPWAGSVDKERATT